MKSRSTQRELMDDLQYEGKDLEATLRELDFINYWLGGERISVQAFKKVSRENSIRSLIDLGCGSGHLLKVLKNIEGEIQYTGIDANPHIIAFARSSQAGIDFKVQNIFDPDFSSVSYDIIHCCLFLHHFTYQELVELFTLFKRQARVAIIVNDLHRHPIAYWSIAFLTAVFSKSKLVRHDAKLSVSRGFKRSEIKKILAETGIHIYRLKWKWAFRWQLIIYTQ